MTLEEKEKAIIEHYNVMPQLKHFQSEVWELNQAIFEYEYVYDEYGYRYDEVEISIKKDIIEELADNLFMVKQFPIYYYELLDCHNIAPYEFKTDNYEHIEDILEYLKNFQKEEICKLTCEIAIAEEREQDYISEYRYEIITEAVDNVIYKLKSIQAYYNISDKEIEEVMQYKADRQLKRIDKEKRG